MCVKCECECVLEDFVLEDFEGGDQHFSADREDNSQQCCAGGNRLPVNSVQSAKASLSICSLALKIQRTKTKRVRSDDTGYLTPDLYVCIQGKRHKLFNLLADTTF